MTKNFFVYTNWTNEILYKGCLTEKEADMAYNELDTLIKNGLSRGVACIGNTDDDYHVAKRLGLVN